MIAIEMLITGINIPFYVMDFTFSQTLYFSLYKPKVETTVKSGFI